MTRTTTSAAAALSGLGMAAMLLWQASGAAFNGNTSNGANIFESASVSLEDDDASSLMFDTSATPMIPGDSYTKCIAVDYNGSSFDVTDVRMYGDLPTNVDNFADQLDVTIELGTGGSFSSCTGFSGSQIFTGTLAGFVGTHTDFGSGLTTWTPSSGNETRVFRFTVTLGSDTPNGSQGDSATANFTWEIQSA